MYQENRLMTIYVEENLHAGTGRALGAVDLPIQRERTTSYPMMQSSGIKGKIRAECDPSSDPTQPRPLAKDVFDAIFGDEGNKFAGAMSVGDAAILLFPVRSLNGVFAWTTSGDVLGRFIRTLARLGLPGGIPESVRQEIDSLANNKAIVSTNSRLIVLVQSTPPEDWIVLEESSFVAVPSQALETLAGWLIKLLPSGSEYDYYKASLQNKLCILPDDAFRDFVRYSTEVQTHIRLNRDTKTVEGKMLWTSESLPSDTLLYAPLMTTPPRTEVASLESAKRTAAGLCEQFETYFHSRLKRLQLGGDETTGQGFVAINLLNEEGMR